MSFFGPSRAKEKQIEGIVCDALKQIVEIWYEVLITATEERFVNFIIHAHTMETMIRLCIRLCFLQGLNNKSKIKEIVLRALRLSVEKRYNDHQNFREKFDRSLTREWDSIKNISAPGLLGFPSTIAEWYLQLDPIPTGKTLKSYGFEILDYNFSKVIASQPIDFLQKDMPSSVYPLNPYARSQNPID